METIGIVHGTYKHFKGGIYEVLGLVRHSETEEWLVLYQSFDGQRWVVSYQSFADSFSKV